MNVRGLFRLFAEEKIKRIRNRKKNPIFFEHKTQRGKPRQRPPPRSSILIVRIATVGCIFFLFIEDFFYSITGTSIQSKNAKNDRDFEKYVYWGSRIDCPGKYCESCEGLGHATWSPASGLLLRKQCIFREPL